MVLLGADLSPEYQPAFDVARAHREGIRFLAVKLSDGLKGWERYQDGIRVIRQATDLGMPTVGYHFLRQPAVPGVASVFAQAETFARQLRRAGSVPGVVDWESTTGSTPTVDHLREMVGETWAAGARLAFTYAPKWYWQRQGAPSLAGLPPLWASRYVTVPGSIPPLQASGHPADLAALVDPAWWEPYGGRPVSLLQFTSKASVAGFVMDANVYRGDLLQLEDEVYGS